MMTGQRCFVRILLAVLMTAAACTAQVQRLQSDRIGGAGLSFEFWKAEEDKISEFAIPVKVVYPYNEKLNLYAMTAPAFSSLKTGVDYSLGGLSDLKWGGHYLFGDDRYLLTFGVNLPTGKSALSVDEYAVASALTIPAFDFRVPSLGQGLDLQVGISTAREMGDFIVGGSVGYLMKGGFKPFDGFDESYNPGDEITLTAGVNRGNLLADLMYTVYFNDKWGGEEVFRSGNKLVLQLMSTFQVSRFDVVVFVREAIKSKNKTGAGDIYETERKNSNANQFDIQGHVFLPGANKYRLKGIVDFKLYSNNDYGTGGATLFGLGAGGEMMLMPGLTFKGEARLYFGSIKSSEDRASAFGLKLFGGVEYTL